ncbi:MAG: VWA domain-containing protein [Pyrinomonadaceae bacterium]
MSSSYRSIVLVRAVLVFGLATILSQTPQRAPVPAAKPQDNPPIHLSVTVTNKQGHVKGLRQENFHITVDKVPSNIVNFSNEDLPVSIGVLLNASASMRRLATDKGKKLRILQEALASFTALSNSANEYFLIGFNERAQLLKDWSTSTTPLVTDEILNLKLSGNTALFDACQVGINKLQDGRHPRRVLFLISDGQDSQSRYTFNELLEVLKQTDTVMYCIHFSDPQPGSALELEGQAILEELARPTGGKFYLASAFKPKEIVSIFESIAAELRSLYMIGIESPRVANEKKWRKIKLKVTVPSAVGEMKNLSARTREGFYASQNPIKVH